MLTCVVVSLAERLKLLVGMVDGLSLRELARIARVSEAYPSLIVSGERENIGTDVARKLAVTLGCSIDYLATGTEPAPTKEQVAAAVEIARAAKAAEDAAKQAEPEPAPESESKPKPAKEPAA